MFLLKDEVMCWLKEIIFFRCLSNDRKAIMNFGKTGKQQTNEKSTKDGFTGKKLSRL